MSESKVGEIPPVDDGWREPLLASLRDCGTQPAPRMVVLRYSLAILAMAFTMGVASILGAILREMLRGAPAPVILGGYALLFVFCVAVLSRIRNRFLRHAWQSSARSAESELLRAGARRPIFYLRSFSLDQQVGRPTWLERYLGTRPFATVEQQVTSLLRRLGPVIAIGRPGEKLPQLGAARFYVSDALWQQKVADGVKASQLVVWASGVTEGLGWEIAHLAERIEPTRFILWAHPHLLQLSPAKTEAEWSRFRDKFGPVFPKPLPEKLGDTRFFLFDASWNPIPVSPRLSDSLRTRQISALRRALLFRQDGLGEMTPEKLREQAENRDTADFGSIIGARTPQPQWWQMGAFFVSLALAACLSGILLHWIAYLTRDSGVVVTGSWNWFSWRNHLAVPLIETAAVVLAFRFIRHGALAVLAAAAGATLALLVLRGSLLSIFLHELALFGCLAWAIRRSTRLLSGAWLGIFLSSFVLAWLGNLQLQLRGFSGVQAVARSVAELIYNPGILLNLPLISATLFAVTLALLLKGIMRWTGEEEVQRKPLGSAELSPELKLLRLIVWDIGRVGLGLLIMLVLLVFMLSSESPYRMWDSEYFHRDEFAFLALLCGLGFAFLVGGVAALIRRRQAWWVSLVLMLVGGLGFAASGPIGSRIYWTQREQQRWAELQANPRDFGSYGYVPARWKRPEAFPLWIEAIERQIARQSSYGWEMPGPQTMLAELAFQRPGNPLLVPIKKRAEELLIMQQGERTNPKQHTVEYYRLWLELLSRPECANNYHAKYLGEEIGNFHAAKPEIAALKPKFEALAAQPSADK